MNAKSDAKTPAQGAIGNDAAGVGTATSGSITDTLTRSHRMTLDEARLILDVKRGDDQPRVMKVSLFRLTCYTNPVLTSEGPCPSNMNIYSKPTPHQPHPRRMRRLLVGGYPSWLIHTTCSQKWSELESGWRQRLKVQRIMFPQRHPLPKVGVQARHSRIPYCIKGRIL
jgi:hypothetical protein